MADGLSEELEAHCRNRAVPIYLGNALATDI
jgi:hypothetical protein